ncbi:MAG: apolipoprotein N-acyltransferase, partial [Chlamydiia bacterium]|nr:apolipoprotein N-acyltransferase [Chlamydiia bacterium]
MAKLVLERVNPSKSALFFVSVLLASLGTPAWVWWLGPVAASLAYGIFFSLILAEDATSRSRFRLAFLWFFIVQGFQWGWFATPEFQGYYIYGAWAALMSLWALQFALFSVVLGWWGVANLRHVFALAGLWTVLEYSRLYVLTGSTFNPVGMALASTLPSLQFASLLGIYGLCFWVILCNLLAVRAYKQFSYVALRMWVCVAVVPYLYGTGQLMWLEAREKELPKRSIGVALVQTASPPIEFLDPKDRANLFDYALHKWQVILGDLKALQKEELDLVVLPESSVPYGTQFPAYTHESVLSTFDAFFGIHGIEALPPLEAPLAKKYIYGGEEVWLVTNLYWAQALANLYSADVVLGLEHHEVAAEGERAKAFNSAVRVQPRNGGTERYDKHLLLPMGEYIPSQWLAGIAAQYGVYASFAPGQSVPVFVHPKIPYAISICYEETFSGFISSSCRKGARLLVNVT